MTEEERHLRAFDWTDLYERRVACMKPAARSTTESVSHFCCCCRRAFDLNHFSGGFARGLQGVWKMSMNQEICTQTSVYSQIRDVPTDQSTVVKKKKKSDFIVREQCMASLEY